MSATTITVQLLTDTRLKEKGGKKDKKKQRGVRVLAGSINYCFCANRGFAGTRLLMNI